MIRASLGRLPEFTELESALQAYLQEATLRVIREEVYDDTNDGAGSSRCPAVELIRRRALPPNHRARPSNSTATACAAD